MTSRQVSPRANEPRAAKEHLKNCPRWGQTLRYIFDCGANPRTQLRFAPQGPWFAPHPPSSAVIQSSTAPKRSAPRSLPDAILSSPAAGRPADARPKVARAVASPPRCALLDPAESMTPGLRWAPLPPHNRVELPTPRGSSRRRPGFARRRRGPPLSCSWGRRH